MGTERQVAGYLPLAYEKPLTPTIVWLTEAFWDCRFGALSRAIWQLQLDFRFVILIWLCNTISFHLYWIANIADLGASRPYDFRRAEQKLQLSTSRVPEYPLVFRERYVEITIHGVNGCRVVLGRRSAVYAAW
jgi:hypothetical protein